MPNLTATNIRPVRRLLMLTLLLSIVSSGLSGCAVNYLVDKLDITDKFRASKANVLNTGALSAETVQELRILALQESFEKDPEKTLAVMEERPVPGRKSEQALALSEAAFFHANKLYSDGKLEAAASFYLMSAAHSYDFLFYSDDKLSLSSVAPFGRFCTELYNASISRIIQIRDTENLPWNLPWEATVGKTVYRFSRDTDGEKQFAAGRFEEYIPAYEIRAKSLKNLYGSQGIGAPLVGKRNNTPNTPDYDLFAPPVVAAPITIVFKFSRKAPPTADASEQQQQVRDVVVSVLDPYRLDTINIAGSEYPIEADYSASMGILIRDTRPGQAALDALLNAGNHLDRIKLYFLQPYDPNKIPVVLIHGLYSSPATYIQMLNDLMGVEDIRRKYQFWVFSYPTGLPIIESSTRLRAALRETAKKLDPDGTSKTFNQMVLVGHSMGGILARTMVVEDSKKLWDGIFTVPIEQLDLTDEERKYALEVGSFEALPSVKRAIFIAAPLRGSDVAQGSLVTRLTRWLISLPETMVTRRQSLLYKNKKFLNPALNNDEFITVARTSVDNLRTDSPILASYINTPISPRVTYHSIIGIQDAKEGLGSSDGIVRYESSHLDGATSEKLVPEGHVCLEHPQTIAEVRRILLVHLAELGNDS